MTRLYGYLTAAMAAIAGLVALWVKAKATGRVEATRKAQEDDQKAANDIRARVDAGKRGGVRNTDNGFRD